MKFPENELNERRHSRGRSSNDGKCPFISERDSSWGNTSHMNVITMGKKSVRILTIISAGMMK